MANRSGWTPFHDCEVTGWLIATIIPGQVVIRKGDLAAQADGRPLRFGKTLQGG